MTQSRGLVFRKPHATFVLSNLV